MSFYLFQAGLLVSIASPQKVIVEFSRPLQTCFGGGRIPVSKSFVLTLKIEMQQTSVTEALLRAMRKLLNCLGIYSEGT